MSNTPDLDEFLEYLSTLPPVPVVPYDPNRPLELHDYQKEAVRFLQARSEAGLFLDMGLGKTAVTLRALTPDHLPVLVVAPKRVAENVWDAEVAKWRPDLTIQVAKGTPPNRKKALESRADIIVIGRDNVADVLPYARKFGTLVIDELSGFKNRASMRWKILRKISDVTPTVWGLTGTPAPNNLLELWPQMYLLDGGKALGKHSGAYRERYFYSTGRLPNGTPINWEARPGADERIHALLEDTCLYMGTEGRVEIPNTTPTINDVVVPMTPKTRQLYKQFKKDLVVNLKLLGLEGEIHSALDAGSVSQKLAQITAGFLYHDEADLRDYTYDLIHLEKARAAHEIIDGTGSPVVVAYWFKAELEILQKELGNLAHTLDEPGILQRWDAGEVPVLLLHPASAGHGLNLQKGGHTMIYTTLPWSPELYQQTNKRLPRQGQTHPVVIHRLVTPHSVDDAKMESLELKKNRQQALLDHLASPL